MATLESACSLDAGNGTLNACSPREPASTYTNGTVGLLSSSRIHPTASICSLPLDFPVQVRVLVLPDTLKPLTTDKGAIDHDIDFLRMVPCLCVLVSRTLNCDMVIDDHQFDVAGSFLEFVVYRPDLVLTNIAVDNSDSAEFLASTASRACWLRTHCDHLA